MTTSTYTARSFVSFTLGALAFAVAAACGGNFESGNKKQPVNPGGQCTGSQTAPADDGCNTCTCSEGSWACTLKACIPEDGGPPSECKPGETRQASCNSCSCSADGHWMCTTIACNTCSPGETTNDGCNTCTCSGGDWVCTNRACPPPPPPECTDGEQKKVDCNTCTCSGGTWGCTKMACPPPACTNGETKFDGCNNCSCFDGQWACTARYCPPPPPPVDAGPAIDAGPPKKGCGGWLGNTCTSDEYCAYTEGQYCGAADASSVCEPRPQACDTIYDPVCGCDMKTYSNACDAAIAGTGVYTKGMCPVPVP